ncbi:MAG: DUF2269 domain-containing protein [Actinomycetota bacterium]|nr:DUF2269 domain-containing protein [Actinomycetota bacterium]
MTLYEFLKFVHVLLAILAVGFNASYGIWLARVAKEPQHESHVLRGIKFLDDRFANPAYVLLLITGIAMVLEGDLEFSTFWIAAGLVLFVVLTVIALAVFTPTLRQQIAVVEAGETDTDEYRRLSKRSSVVGAFLGVIVVVIVFLMVTKPTL